MGLLAASLIDALLAPIASVQVDCHVFIGNCVLPVMDDGLNIAAWDLKTVVLFYSLNQL